MNRADSTRIGDFYEMSRETQHAHIRVETAMYLGRMPDDVLRRVASHGEKTTTAEVARREALS